MVEDLSQYFINTNKTVHKGRFCGELKFDPVHTGNQGFKFYAEDIEQNTVSITHQASSTSDISIGGVFLGCLKLTFLPTVTSTRTASNYWTKGMISLYYEEETDNPSPSENFSGEEGWESIKVGDYYIKDAYFQNKLLYITAYDGLCLFDQPLDENPGGTFRSLVNRAVGKARQLFDISIHNATAEDHFEDFPNENRNVVYSLYYENDVSTWRDLLYWIAVSVCGFFWVDRNGGLRIFSYRNSYSWKEDPDWSINYDERIAGSSQIADFKTSYDGIRITDLILEEDAIYTYEGYNARLLDIGANPFYQNLSTAQKSEFRMDLGHVVVTDMIVRPFRVDMKSAPIFDLGDKIAFENGDWLPWEENSRAAMSVIHSWIFSKNTLTLQAYGARRETVYTRSGSGGGSSGGIAGKGKTTEYFSYKNRETITVGTLNTSVELGAIDFYAEQETIIEAIAQLNPEHTGSGDWSVEYSWELDGVSEFGAISTGNDNSQPQSIETLAHIKDILTPGIHTLKLKAKLQTQSNNAASTFEADKGVKIILKGQGLEHQSIWNGIISLSDDWEKIQPSVGLKSFTELVDIYFVDWWKMQFSDSVPKLQAAQKIKSITETFVLKLSSQEFDIEGEDGTVLTTEDGFVLQTE